MRSRHTLAARSRSARKILCTAALLAGPLITASPAKALDISDTWVGASGQTWSGGSNWNPAVAGGPRNGGGVNFYVRIPANIPIFDPTSATTISGLSIGSSSGLQFTNTASHSLSVASVATLNGVIDMNGLSTMTLLAQPVNLDNARFNLRNGSLFASTVGSVVYSSAGLTSTTTIMSAGTASLLDLRSLAGLDAGFNNPNYPGDTQLHTIQASNGGKIDLSNVATVTVPVQGNDGLQFLLNDASSIIDLASLGTISGAGGYSLFTLSNGAVQTLPSIRSMTDTFLFASGGAHLTAAGSLSASYSSSGIWWTTPIMSSDGSNTLLDLRALTTLDIGFDNPSYPGDTQVHTITATNGGKIDLSNVTTVTVPVQSNDGMQFLVSGANSTIDLANLGTISGAGGFSQFTLSNGAAQTLPSIRSMTDTFLLASGGGQLTAAGSLTASYSSSGIWWSTTIMSSDGTNSLLDLRALRTLDTGFNNPNYPGDTQVHTIQAIHGGRIDLSNVTTLTVPVQSNDGMQFLLTDANSTIDLASLGTISGAGGYSQFTLSNGAVQTLPSIRSMTDTFLLVSSGAHLTAAGSLSASYSSGGIWWTTPIMTADGTNTLLDLRALSTLDTGFNNPNYPGDTQVQTIQASNGGKIDLSNVTTVTVPVQSNDGMQFLVSGANSTIDLAHLGTISGAGGYSQFTLSNGASQLLPSIRTMTDTFFVLSGGAQLSAAGSLSATYSSEGIWWTTSIMSSDGTNTLLDLRALRTLDAGFNNPNYPGDTQLQTIKATNGGKIDLSNVTLVKVPVQGNDGLQFMLTDGASTIDLANLQTISGAGGYTQFALSNGAVQTLPSIQSMGDVFFNLSGGARLTAAGAPASYSSSGIWWSTPIMTSDGTNTRLDLRAVTTVDAGFNNPNYPGDTQVHTIQAIHGGQIDLRNVATLTAPVQGNDRLDIIAGTATLSDSSMIDLSSLHWLKGGGPIRFIANGNSTLRLGSIYTTKAASITVNDAARLEASTHLRLGSAISLNAHAGTQIDINGRFSYGHTNVANMNLSDGTITGGAIVTMHGGGQKVMEVGGVDYGTATFLLNDGNFGMGRLVVGIDGQPTDVTLFDLANNGHRSGGFESLYLFGNAGQDGLAINPGSKLVLNDLNAYANIGGTFTNLKDLIPPGQGSVAFDKGYIVLHNLPSTPADVNGDGRVTGADIDLERDAIAGASPQLSWFDTNDDQTVNSGDLNYLLVDLLHTKPGDANLDGKVDLRDLYELSTHYQWFGDVGWGEGDFNGDFTVNARDLGDIARNWQYGVAGPAMSFAEALAAVNTGASVPEPGCCMIIGSILATLLPRRRRHA